MIHYILSENVDMLCNDMFLSRYKFKSNLCVCVGSPRLSCRHGIEFHLCLQLMFVQRFSQLDPLDPRASETTLLKALFMHSHLLLFHLFSYVLLSYLLSLSHLPMSSHLTNLLLSSVSSLLISSCAPFTSRHFSSVFPLTPPVVFVSQTLFSVVIHSISFSSWHLSLRSFRFLVKWNGEAKTRNNFSRNGAPESPSLFPCPSTPFRCAQIQICISMHIDLEFCIHFF